MTKFFKTVFLLAVIALCVAFIYAKAASIGADTNYFNTHWRAKLDRYPLLRTVLGLHYDGDARADFLGGRYGKIVIEVDALSDVTVDSPVLERLAAAIQNITGKPTSYVLSDTNIPLSNLSDADVAGVIGRYRDFTGGDAANLYVLLADSKKGDSKLLGSTYQEYGIVVYLQSIAGFASNAPVTYQNYEFSTLLHEFGHQLGLDHNNTPGCLMNPKAESSDQPVFDAGFVVTDFCIMEKQQIAEQKQVSQ